MTSGRRGEFAMEYPCHSHTEWCWFVIREMSFPAHGRLRVMITDENITERKRMEEQLERQIRKLAEALGMKEVAGVVSRSSGVA